ncbi:sensor histidine kinase [Chitinophaga lutea]|nr:sensor histidine kinase [Chitinophaga lutea]
MHVSLKARPLFLITALLLLRLAAAAMPQSHIFSRLTAEDGLRSNYVHAVMQDKSGFMWVGSQGGLQRYDGRQFEYFPFPQFPGVARQGVQHIIETNGNTLWIAYNTCVVTYDYVREKAALVPVQYQSHEKSFQATQLFTDSRGLIWLCTSTHGTFLYDRVAKAFVPFSRFFGDTAFRIFNVAEDPLTHDYWLGTSIGLCLLDYRNKHCYTPAWNPHRIPLLAEPAMQRTITRLYGDSRGGLFINTWGRLEELPSFFHYNPKTRRLGAPQRMGAMAQLLEDRKGMVWSAGDKLLLFSSDGNLQQEFQRDQFARYGLDYTDMFCLEEDNMQNIWIGTSNGLFIFNHTRQQFQTTAFKPAGVAGPSPLLEAADIWQHPNGDVWVASWGQGLLVYDSTLTLLKKHLLHPTDYQRNMLWCLQPLPDGRVLAGAQHANLLTIDPRTWAVEYRVLSGLDNRTIRCMTLDAGGNVWIGTQRGLIAKWDYRRDNIRVFRDSLYRKELFLWNHVQDIHAGSDGHIWAGTANYGLLKLDTAGNIVQRFATDEKRHTLPGDNVRQLQPAGNNLLLVGAGGIAVIDMQHNIVINTLTEEQGLPGNVITNLVPISAQQVFFTSNFSAGKVNLQARKVVHFGRKYGVADESFQLPASMRLRDGRIVFGATKNILSFQPDSLREPQRPPDVRIHYFKTGGDVKSPYQPMQAGGARITLDHTSNTFTIGYTSLAYLEQDNLTYYYRLEGIDAGWVNAGQRQYVNYSNLAPGDYVFHVYCENGEGLATRSITSMAVSIAKPLWRKGWFYAAIVLLIAGAVFLVHSLRVNRIMATEQVRRRIARDLHDDMGSTLTSINIMSSMARRNADRNDLSKTLEFLVKIGESTTQMMESMDDIVWSINPLNDNTQRVIARMREFTTGVLEARQIGFSFLVDEKIFTRKLRLESRHDFFMIYKEAITNIAKYAQCTFTDIRVQLRKGQLVLRVQDNGVGFNISEAGEGDGLQNMQRRAYRMNGQLSIQSQLGKGTVVVLMFPTT